MKKFFLLIALGSQLNSFAQVVVNSKEDAVWKTNYRAEATKINDLVNTKLDVKFDFNKAYMYGKEWLTATPHFYATDSLKLDAKGMNINEVSIYNNGTKKKLQYIYDSTFLNIKLDKTYKSGEQYTVYIDYVSKPNELKEQGSAAITDAKGLYFINPKGEEKNKPTEIWTQGETESNSVWMPTIDKPNQKSTEEISMTVPSKFVTLSNGLLIKQQLNTDGTRIDTWKMDLPHAPYLFFMGIGEYSIIKDSYKGKEVAYYVEKEYAPVARKIFGNTPEMIKFYSEKLGVDFAWQKYDQIVGRDYVSGAMENTTCTLHQESAYQNARQLVDGNSWEEVIAHELFHQWFGDLVTCESWSNLTVNESFADFSETLWDEHKYGKDAGDAYNYEAQQGYLLSASPDKNLVRFYYKDKEDMFDAVTYQKGGRILNMLRNYVGDDAFFKALNNYLVTNKFKTGEAQQLRFAFEQTTGQDLNWYWNQWYYSNGHPVLNINYNYDDAAGKATVIIEQKQTDAKLFKLPIAIDVYNGVNKIRYKVWAQNKIDSFTFNYKQRPDLINVDADKIILCEKTDNKTAANYITQIKYAPLYLDRREALDYFDKAHMKELLLGLQDKYPGLRSHTLELINQNEDLLKDPSTFSAIEKIANTEKDKKTKAKALSILAGAKNTKYKSLFEKNINDSSYSVAGAAFEGLVILDTANAYSLAKKYSVDARGDLADAIGVIIMDKGTEADFDFVSAKYDAMPPGQDKVQATEIFCNYLSTINDEAKIKAGIDQVIKFKKQIPENFSDISDQVFKAALNNIAKAKGGNIANYIQNVLK